MLGVVYSNLHREGIDVEKHSAPVVRPEDELLYWEKGFLGCGSPKLLQRTVFLNQGRTLFLRIVSMQMSVCVCLCVRP